MKKYQAEVERQMLENEQEVIDKIKKTYEQALKDVDAKLKKLYDDIDKLVKEQPENESLIRSKIYQKNYQEQIRKQITSNLDALKDSSVKNIEDYMAKMYEDGYLSTFYELQKEGVAVTAPINQELLVEAVTFNTADIPLSKRVYDNVELAKKRVLGEVTRGISSAMSVHEIARNIENVMKVSMKKANILAQNEGARVRLKATMDGAYVARSKGADVVKQWDATLDSKTRPVHRELDQQVAELDEPFKYSGGEVMQPKEFGIAALDINCRCALLILPRWDVQDTYKRRDNISKNLVEAKNYADWKKKYYNEIEKSDESIINSKWNSGVSIKPVVTKEEAINRLANDYGISFKDSRKYPIDEQFMVNGVNWLSEFNEKFKDFEKSNKCKIPIINVLSPSGMNGSLGYYRYYKSSNKVVEIMFSGKDFANFEDYKEHTKKMFENGFKSGQNPIHTFIHEYGHHISNSLKWKTGDPDWQHNFIKECIDEFSQTHSEAKGYWDMSKYVSRYGASKESDLFAESFAEYFGEEEPREFAKLFGEKLEKVLKGEKL